MKQENDQNTIGNHTASPSATRSTPVPNGNNDAQKPKGTIPLVLFPTLLGPNGGGAIQGYFALLFTFVYISCSSIALSPEDYLKWTAEHQSLLAASQQQGYISTTLTYLAPNLLAINEISSGDAAQIGAARKEYEGLEYYQLRLAASSGEGDVLQLQAASTYDYYQRVEYFSFGMQNDLRLLIGPDTLPCRLFHFERNYGTAPYLDFMLGFDQKEATGFDRTLIFYDRVYSNSTIQLMIPIKNINSIPSLKL